MGVLSDLEPRKVFRFFEEICAIPHGSGNTKAVSDHVAAFAAERGLDCRQDAVNNVVIRKPASAGYEKAPVVMLQGHMDMVCEKEPECTKNMRTEGLELFTDGDLVGARGTTLGADDGIAVAMMMAILDSDDIPHGPLECVFTIDEETGLGGAEYLDTSDLKAAYMINIDSEEEGVLTVSCAGSSRNVCRLPLHREAFSGEHLEILIDGMLGGHSGQEIQKGRANAIIQMGRMLTRCLEKTDLRLITVSGGGADNAIPRTAKALIAGPAADTGTIYRMAERLTEELNAEYGLTDGKITVTVSPADDDSLPASAEDTRRAAALLFCMPNGVQAMSAGVPGLVQTSSNLGRVYPVGDGLVCTVMPRSCINSQHQELLDKIRTLCSLVGAELEAGTCSGTWEYRPQSALRETMIEAYRALYGSEPVVAAIHAGLECGIFAAKMPGLDCVSIGPDLTDIHTPKERLHIASAQRTWQFVLETLKRLK